MLKRRKNNHSYFESFIDHWKEMSGSFAAGFLKSFTESFMDKLRFESARILSAIRKSVMGLGLILAGMLFVLVGLAQFVNDLVSISDGFGYLVVGILALVFGGFIIKK